jgi:cyclase
MEQVSKNIFVNLDFVGCNVTCIVTLEGLVLVDTPQMPSDALKWRNEVTQKGEVHYLINTEHHMDHITGNYYYTGIGISSQETRRLMSEIPVEQVAGKVKQNNPAELSLMDDKYAVRLPTITFSDRMTLYLGSHTFNLIYLPGHTLGELAVHIPEERVLITGDNIFCEVQTWMKEADPFKWLESLKIIEKMDFDVLIPGHGRICDKSYIREQSAFIQEWIEAVKKAIEKGLSKEEAMKTISFLVRYPMAGKSGPMGPQVQRWNVEKIYDLLTGPYSGK